MLLNAVGQHDGSVVKELTAKPENLSIVQIRGKSHQKSLSGPRRVPCHLYPRPHRSHSKHIGESTVASDLVS